jgi:hypothetical protein
MPTCNVITQRRGVALTCCALGAVAKQAATFLWTFHEQATAMNKYPRIHYLSEPEVSSPSQVGATESCYHLITIKGPLLKTPKIFNRGDIPTVFLKI